MLAYNMLHVVFIFLELQELNLNGFITHELSFEEINKAFDLLVKGETIRCVLWMDK